MKKILKNLLMIIILPVMIFSSGCSLFDNDDETLTYDQMLQKFYDASASSLESVEYSKINSTSISINVETELYEAVITKNSTGYYYDEIDDNYENAVVKDQTQTNRYIEYIVEEGKESRYLELTDEDFNENYNVSKDELQIIDSLSENKLKTEFENVVVNTIGEMSFEITNKETLDIAINKLENDFVMTIPFEGKATKQNTKYQITANVKITYNTKITKVVFDIVLKELNLFGNVEEEGNVYKINKQTTIKYSFNSQYAITDFSNYPIPQ